ncbi:MAG: Rne/Rng family ribonuclease [Desulfuromonadales bacterium]
MSKKMLVNATHHEENRVAIVEDGILTELDIEVAGHEPTKGNIYRAVVVRVESGLQAAFVDYGAERLGFLQIDEVNYRAVKPDYQASEDGRRPRITDLLQRGQEILVQITKEERGTKGAAMTTYLSLAGRYMVIMPGSQTRGVSRKAESDAQRKDLKKAMSSIDLEENIGYIVRTAALNQSREELERDYRYLIRLYESIVELNKKVKAPALIYKESNLIIRSIRDYFTTDMDEVLIDDPQVFKEARDFFQMVMPDQVRLVKLHQEKRPIFSRYQIEEQIETLSRSKVPLPSGGSIVIDTTEALVAIDVNSGKMASEQGVEATASKTNIEAAREIGRQLRLRDLGGLVVIDFIDMRERKNMREVEKELKKSLENDKARVSVGRISQFGLLEMSRQRLKATLAEGSYLTCPHCGGSGRLKSPESQAVSLLRKIHASAAKGQVSRVDAQLPMDVATYLLNHKRGELVDMERDHQLQIHVHGNRDFLADQIEIEITKREKDTSSQPEYVAAALLPMSVAEESPTAKDPQAPAEGKENGAEPAKKRRRRKRRKPSDAESSEDKAAANASSATTGNDATVPDQDVAGAEASAEPPAPKSKRRRSRSKSKPSDAIVPSASAEEATRSEAEEANDPPPQAKEEEKPKRRSPRRRAKSTAKQEQQDTATAQAPTDQSDDSGDTQAADAKSPSRRRPRRAPRKTASKPADETSADSPTDQEAKPVSETSGEGKMKSTGRRRTNRKPKSSIKN